MLKQYLKFGWRNLIKQKGLFAINIFGLAVGIATCLMISLYILDETSYDRFNTSADRIARVILKGVVQGEAINEAISPAGIAPAFQDEFPEVLEATRLKATEIPLIRHGQTSFRESRFAYVDPNFFSVFSIQFLKGNPKTALEEPNTVLITESEAKKYFGNKDPMGKTLEFDDWGMKLKITGVIADIPGSSHYHFDLFGSMKSYENINNNDWLASDFHSYVLIRDDSKFEDLQKKIPAIKEKYMGSQLQEAFGISMAQFEESGNKIGLYLQPLLDIHLYSDLAPQSELEAGGNINNLYIFGIIGLFALLVSCINFINLSTAAASRRMKEVGLKKVLGSGKSQLVIQFISESFLTTLAAMLVASILIGLSLHFFNDISGKTFHFIDFLTPDVILFYAIFGILTSIMAGVYPAFILSSFKPLAALSKQTNSKGGTGLRNGLVIFQFAISTILIIGTLVVDRQMEYIKEKDIGYEKEGLIVVNASGVLGENGQKVFKEKLLAHSSVENVTISNHLPAGPTNSSMDNVFLDEVSTDFRRSPVYHVDERYIPTLGIQLLAGRNFSTDFGAEANSVIVNETFAKKYGLGENPVGKSIETMVGQTGEKEKAIVIGLIKDFHFQPLHRNIEPLIMRKNESSGTIVRAKMSNVSKLLIDMEQLWRESNIDEPFQYALLDDLYNTTYINEQKVGKLFKAFAAFTIFIATLGLFGLITFAVNRRTKEIGIRKVLGSNTTKVVSLLSLDFLKLIGLALIIAFPIGYVVMNIWLEDFAYRIDINWSVFAISGAITLILSWLTVTAKSWKAASVNPVDSLKDE